MNLVIQFLCAFGAGVSIVIARSVNAYLAQRIGATQSSFFNYLTGFITSLLCLFLFSFSSIHIFSKLTSLPHYWMLLGGVIGVANIIILNIVVHKITPLQLTLVIFVTQLASGMLLDVYLYQMFSLPKFLGCMIVLIGLMHYQYVLKKEKQTIK